MPATFTPATERQISFLNVLRTERGMEPVLPGALSKSEASEQIGNLKGTPRPRTQTQTAAPQAARADVPDGHYAILRTDALMALPGDDDTLFVRVNTGKAGRWQGFQFVDQLSGDNRKPVKDRALKTAVLAAIAADVMGALTRYGRETQRCGICRIRLTDDDSRAMGIGPDCFEKVTGRRRRAADIPVVLPEQPAAPVVPAPAPAAPHVQCTRCNDTGVEDYDDDGIDTDTGAPIMRPVRCECIRQAERTVRAALDAGTDPHILEDGIREDEAMTPVVKRHVRSILGVAIERRMQAMEAEGDRNQTTVEETRRAIARARAEGDLKAAQVYEQDPAYIAARRAEFGW